MHTRVEILVGFVSVRSLVENSLKSADRAFATSSLFRSTMILRERVSEREREGEVCVCNLFPIQGGNDLASCIQA